MKTTKTELDRVAAFMARRDGESSGRVGGELSDPGSDASQLLEAARVRTRAFLGEPKPAQPRPAVTSRPTSRPSLASRLPLIGGVAAAALVCLMALWQVPELRARNRQDKQASARTEQLVKQLKDQYKQLEDLSKRYERLAADQQKRLPEMEERIQEKVREAENQIVSRVKTVDDRVMLVKNDADGLRTLFESRATENAQRLEKIEGKVNSVMASMKVSPKGTESNTGPTNKPNRGQGARGQNPQVDAMGQLGTMDQEQADQEQGGSQFGPGGVAQPPAVVGRDPAPSQVSQGKTATDSGQHKPPEPIKVKPGAQGGIAPKTTNTPH